ncbi:hypothetical protein IWX49DRAFT_402254 [Phyllosticta citricarpa]|uniref:Uncharacterized protein n=1 Tax=Phyllosticta citricarpa TaxID=55181 RepID=A0ABR1LXW3_9PEZI
MAAGSPMLLIHNRRTFLSGTRPEAQLRSGSSDKQNSVRTRLPRAALGKHLGAHSNLFASCSGLVPLPCPALRTRPHKAHCIDFCALAYPGLPWRPDKAQPPWGSQLPMMAGDATTTTTKTIATTTRNDINRIVGLCRVCRSRGGTSGSQREEEERKSPSSSQEKPCRPAPPPAPPPPLLAFSERQVLIRFYTHLLDASRLVPGGPPAGHGIASGRQQRGRECRAEVKSGGMRAEVDEKKKDNWTTVSKKKGAYFWEKANGPLIMNNGLGGKCRLFFGCSSVCSMLQP